MNIGDILSAYRVRNSRDGKSINIEESDLQKL